MRCVVRNGQVLATEGEVLANGATLTGIIDIDVSPAGLLAIAIGTELGGISDAAVLVEGLPLVTLGAPVLGPGVPAGASLASIREVAIANPHVLVRGSIAGMPGFPDAVVRFTLGQGNPGGDVLIREGSVDPNYGIVGLLPNGLSSIDVLPDGRAFSPITFGTAQPLLEGHWFDGAVVQIEGGPTPDGAALWDGAPAAFGGVGPDGEILLAGPRTTAGGAGLPRALYVDGAQFLEGGDPLGFGTFTPATTFATLDGSGRLIWAHDGGTASGVYVDQEPVFTVSQGLVDGSPLLFVRADTGQFASSPSGRFVMFEGDETLATQDALLCIVETELGVPFNACPAVPNSTGSVGTIEASGSSWIGAGPISLVASDLPANSLALMLCSRTPFITMNPGGSSGNLCLGGSIGRFFGQIGLTTAAGTFEVTANAQFLPTPTGLVAASAGELWGFQAGIATRSWER